MVITVTYIAKSILGVYTKAIHGQNALSSNGIESDTII